MQDVLDIYDDVYIIKTNKRTSIVEVVESKTRRLTDGKIVINHDIRYRLEGHVGTYRADEISFCGMKAAKEYEIDSVIIDALLAQKKFDYLKQLANEDMKPDAICTCGGGMYETYFDKGISGLRCLDCQVIITK